jgi:hypothetical protein
MVVSLQVSSDFKLPDTCGYNKIFRHNWVTPVYGLSQVLIPVIHNICKANWGWHFKPHKDMNYHSDQWYEKQSMVLSFESQIDLIIVKLSIDIHK